jgi:hypothetical protein
LCFQGKYIRDRLQGSITSLVAAISLTSAAKASAASSRYRSGEPLRHPKAVQFCDYGAVLGMENPFENRTPLPGLRVS